MSDILTKIEAYKRKEIAAAKRNHPLSSIEALAKAAPAPRGSSAQPSDAEAAQEAADPEAEAASARSAFIELVTERRMAHLFAVLLRMGAI